MAIPIPGLRGGPDAISPTAHYTGETWVRNGLSHPALATIQGRTFFAALQPTMAISGTLGGPTLEGMLLARHRIIDDLLARSVESGAIGQVIEVACGMSPRGWRFASRWGDGLVYVEADLPAMAARKRSALERMGSLSAHHRVADLDVLRPAGDGSLAAISAELDPGTGTAIITEGLLSYLGDGPLSAVWHRFAHELERFSRGLYLSDLRLAAERDPVEQVFNRALGAFVRGGVHPHFGSEGAAAAALEAAGFDSAALHRGDLHPAAGDRRGDPGAALIHVIEGRIGRWE